MRLISRLSLVLASAVMAGTTLAAPLANATDSDPINSDPPNPIALSDEGGASESGAALDSLKNEAGASDDVTSEDVLPGSGDKQSGPTLDEPQSDDPAVSALALGLFAVDHPVSAAREATAGENVEAEGWVTATYPTGNLNGYVIQTAGSGGACDFAKTSEAIFVFLGAGKPASDYPAIGDYVNVTGTRAAYQGLEQISSPVTTKITDTTGIAPAEPLTCEWPGTEIERQAIQSMLFIPSGDLAVTNNYDANSYGSLTISTTGKPLQQPTDVAPEDSDLYNATVALNDASKFILDDGSSMRFAGAGGANIGNQKLTPPYVFNDGRTAVGAKVTFTKPVIVDYRNNSWTLNTTTQITPADALDDDAYPATFTASAPGAPTLESLGNPDVVVGGFNLENYFPINQGGNWKVACTSYNDNDGNPITTNRCPDYTENGVTVTGPRGAWDKANLDRQTAKLVPAINNLDASVLGIMELENSYKLSFGDKDQAGASAAYLVDQLNAAAGYAKWDYIVPDVDNAEPINQQDVMYPGIIYQPEDVTPIGDNLILNDQSGEGEAFGNARAPFGQAFEPAGGGEPFFFVANHFKSKSCSTGMTGGAQGCFNEDRTNQANALAAWIEVVLPELSANTGKTVEDVVLVGDFNAYTFEDPMLAFYEAGYANVNVENGTPVQSSYNYGGMDGSLDHVIISESALDRATGHAIWDINGSQSIAYNYSRFNATGGEFVQGLADTPLRSSDHSPAVVGFKADTTVPESSVIQLLNINDFHGRIDGKLGDGEKNCAAPELDTRPLTSSDTMNFAYTIEKLKADGDVDGTLFLSAGDNIGASLFASAVQKDKPTIELLKALGLEASAVGNHEFDGGKAWINEVNGWIGGAFPYLAANVIDDATGQVAAPFKSSATFDVAGKKVAVIGAVTQETPTLVSPEGVAGYSFTDPVEAVNAEVTRLMGLDESERPDVIVAEYHDGAAEGKGSTLEAELASSPSFKKLVEQTSADVDVIFTGHTHKEYAWEAPYGDEGKTRPVVQTGSYGQNIGRVVLSIDNATGAVSAEVVENVATAEVAADGNWNADLNDGKGGWQIQDISVLEGFNAATEEAYVIIRDAVRLADCEGGKVTGRLSADVSRAYTSCTYTDGKAVLGSDAKEDRGGASPLGTLVSNMLRSELGKLPGGVDLGVTNPGGLRTDMAAGDVTVAQARAVLPFNNELSIVTMTGDQIYTMLEQQWQRGADGTVPSRPFLYLGLSDNVRYTYHEVSDPANEGAVKGVVDTVFIDGKLIDKAAEYRVGTFTFLAAGGDNFWVFQDAPNINTGLLDYEQWLAYLASESGVEGIAPNFVKQGIKVDLDPADGAVKAGESLKATYSELNICAIGAPENTDATLDVTGPFGVSSSTEKVTDGAVTFTVPMPVDVKSGELVLDMTALPSDSLATSYGTVTAGTTPGPDPKPGTDGKLPDTGASVLWFLIAGLGLTAAGTGIAVKSRRENGGQA
ncbi:ExeM/NucH family extracellular endonuclease [Actinomycetaceae bacterium MB13-C1-2]|nr:ExeM/NucH family extracellular endonuclease [Actinomycetaceae bacterium MB13-C1-2]